MNASCPASRGSTRVTGSGAPTTVVMGWWGSGSRPESVKMPMPRKSGWLVPQYLRGDIGSSGACVQGKGE